MIENTAEMKIFGIYSNGGRSYTPVTLSQIHTHTHLQIHKHLIEQATKWYNREEKKNVSIHRMIFEKKKNNKQARRVYVWICDETRMAISSACLCKLVCVVCTYDRVVNVYTLLEKTEKSKKKQETEKKIAITHCDDV